MVLLTGQSVLFGKGESQVSWFSRLPHWLKSFFGQGRRRRRRPCDRRVRHALFVYPAAGAAQVESRRRLGAGKLSRAQRRQLLSSPAAGRCGTTAVPRATARCPRSRSSRRTSSSWPTDGRPAGRRASQPDGGRADSQGDRPPPVARGKGAHAASRKRSGTRSPTSIKRSSAAQARSTNIPTWGRRWYSPSSGSIGFTWPASATRGLPPARRQARAAHQGPLAGRRPARRRHDHRRRAADAQIQERACISTWAARTPAAVPKTFGSSTCVPATGCSWPATA